MAILPTQTPRNQLLLCPMYFRI